MNIQENECHKIVNLDATPSGECNGRSATVDGINFFVRWQQFELRDHTMT